MNPHEQFTCRSSNVRVAADEIVLAAQSPGSILYTHPTHSQSTPTECLYPKTRQRTCRSHITQDRQHRNVSGKRGAGEMQHAYLKGMSFVIHSREPGHVASVTHPVSHKPPSRQAHPCPSILEHALASFRAPCPCSGVHWAEHQPRRSCRLGCAPSRIDA